MFKTRGVKGRMNNVKKKLHNWRSMASLRHYYTADNLWTYMSGAGGGEGGLWFKENIND